jgi:predicted nucleotidyltransferase
MQQSELAEEISNIVNVIREAVDCERIYLFGSYADGQPNESSDLDFYVVLTNDSPRPLEARRKISRGLSHIKRKMPVDILANYESVFTEMSRLPSLERHIVRAGVLLYEHG